jgi:hypothetical protein
LLPPTKIELDRCQLLAQMLVISRDTVIPILVQRADRDSLIVGNETDQLLPDVFHLVVLLEEAYVVLDNALGRHAETD